MVHKRDDGSWVISGAIPEDMAQKAKEKLDENPELSDGGLIREAFREYLD